MSGHSRVEQLLDFAFRFQPFVLRREVLGKMCISNFKLLPIHMLATFSFLSFCIWAKL